MSGREPAETKENTRRIRVLKNLRVDPAGNKVRAIREGRDMTQEELSRRSGVSQNSISRIETGARKPRKSTLEKLARALDIEDPAVLTGGGFGDIVTFEEILQAPAEMRRGYLGMLQELDELEPFLSSLEEHYAENVGRVENDPEYMAPKLEAALMLGYIMGYREGRKRQGEDDET